MKTSDILPSSWREWPRTGEAVMSRHLCVMHEMTGGCVEEVAHQHSPELSRVQPSSGKFLVSSPVKRWVPPHLPTVPEHRFRESSQMAAHDSFASSGPSADSRLFSRLS